MPGKGGKVGGKADPRENQYTVFLEPEHVDFLDDVRESIRRRNRTRLNRSALIRGIVKGIAQGGIDLASAESEDDIVALIKARLRK